MMLIIQNNIMHRISDTLTYTIYINTATFSHVQSHIHTFTRLQTQSLVSVVTDIYTRRTSTWTGCTLYSA